MTIDQQYELFDAHLEGSLSADEQKLFDALMLDTEAKNNYETFCAIQKKYMDIVKNEEKEKDFVTNLKIIGKNYTATEANSTIKQAENKPKATLGFTKNLKWVASIAAITILGFFVYTNLRTPKQDMQSLFASNYTVDNLSLERGSTEDSLTQIATLYNNKQYQEVLPLIKTYSALHPNNGNVKIALATCYLSANDFASTENTLNNLIAQQDVYTQKAQWYLAMCYLKQHKKDAAIALLSSLDAKHFYAEKAKQIVKELQKN